MSLVEQLVEEKILKTPHIIKAFRAIRRKDFLPDNKRDQAELNAPLEIGYGQTISQSLTVAFMLELLQPLEGQKVLDVGSGSGWTTALIAEIVAPSGQVFAIERILELKEFGEKNAEKYQFISRGIARFITGDGSRGLPTEAPFDRILVSAAARSIPPALINELSPGGRLVIPVGPAGLQDLVLVEKLAEGQIKQTRHPGFAFVPLIED